MSRIRASGAVMAVIVLGACLGTAGVARAETVGLTVVAGTGSAGSSGDGGPAAQAQLHAPAGVAVAGDGTVYIADTGNHTVRAVAPSGTISTVAGTGRLNSAAANSGKVDPADTTVAPGTAGTGFNLAAPSGLAVGPDNTLYIADTGLSRVFALAPDGTLRVFAGAGTTGAGASGDGGAATAARLGRPAGVAVAGDGTVYIADTGQHRVRAVGVDGVITTAAGTGAGGLTAAGGPATQVSVGTPERIAVDGQGAVWIISELTLLRLAGGRLATVTTTGDPTPDRWGVTDSGAPVTSTRNSLVAVAASGDTVIALDGGDQTLRRLRSGNAVDTIATGNHALTGPLAMSPAGLLYLVDSSNSRVYSLRLPEPPAGGPGSPARRPWWPFAAAGALAVVVIGGWLLIRRRPGR